MSDWFEIFETDSSFADNENTPAPTQFFIRFRVETPIPDLVKLSITISLLSLPLVIHFMEDVERT
jgi:hypothetical protein